MHNTQKRMQVITMYQISNKDKNFAHNVLNFEIKLKIFVKET